jgi:hypothetical protein
MQSHIGAMAVFCQVTLAGRRRLPSRTYHALAPERLRAYRFCFAVGPSVGGVNWIERNATYIRLFPMFHVLAILRSPRLDCGGADVLLEINSRYGSITWLGYGRDVSVRFRLSNCCGPIVAGLLFLGWASSKIMDPGASETTQNPFVIVVSLGLALTSFCLMLGMSLAGFYGGWRTGWACGKGLSLRDALSEASTLKLLFRLLQKSPLTRLAGFAPH